MSEILKFVSTARTMSPEADSLFAVALFCGVGILASLLTMILDRDLFSAWSYF